MAMPLMTQNRHTLDVSVAATGLIIDGVDRLIAACAVDDARTVHEIREREPRLVRELLAQGPTLLAEFAGTWNTPGVRHLLDLGVPVNARYAGDGYFDIAKESTALHVAAWHFYEPDAEALQAL